MHLLSRNGFTLVLFLFKLNQDRIFIFRKEAKRRKDKDSWLMTSPHRPTVQKPTQTRIVVEGGKQVVEPLNQSN